MVGFRKLKGSIVAVVTPMEDNPPFKVDFEALKALVQWHVQQGTDGILVAGTTGEAATLTSEEWADVISTTIQAADNQIPVIAGTGTNCTADTIVKTQRAASLGVAAALVVVPYYNRPTQEGLKSHYRSVAAACPSLPIILYNVPSRTSCDLLPATAQIIASSCANVIGIKEASAKPERFRELRKLCGPDFLIYSGEDDTAMSDMTDGGADGVISVTANVAPHAVKAVCDAALAAKPADARAMDAVLQPLHKALFVEPNPIAVKFALKEMGKIQGGIRLPLLPLSCGYEKTLREALRVVQDKANGSSR